MRALVAVRRSSTSTTWVMALLSSDLGIRQIVGVLVDLGMRPVERYWLQQILHQLVFFGIHSIVQLVDEEIVIILSLFLFLAEGLKVLLAFFHSNQVEGRWHLF